MTTSEKKPTQAFVWVWLPGETTPVVAGLLSLSGDRLLFNYGRSYLGRNNAISLYEPELPLRSGALPLAAGLKMPNSIRDAAPDAWGLCVDGRHRGPHIKAAVDAITKLIELRLITASNVLFSTSDKADK